MNADQKKELRLEEELDERRKARERWRYVQPKTAGKVLAHHRYWTRQFVTFYRERCEELALDCPGDAYLLSQQLVEVTRRVRAGEAASYFATATDKMSAIVSALAVHGMCCCAHGEMDEAQLSFGRAFAGLGDRKASPRAMAELHVKHAQFLELSEAPLEEVASDVARCLEICEEAGLGEVAAEAHVIQSGLCIQSDSGNPLAESLEAARLASPRTHRGKRICHVALNLAIQMARESRLGLRMQESALLVLNAFKIRMKGTPTNSRKLKALWIEGLLLGNLKIERHAVRQATKARRGLLLLEKVAEYAICSLDLAAMHLRCGEEAEARSVIQDTDRELVARGLDARAWPSEATQKEVLRAIGVFDSMPRRLISPGHGAWHRICPAS